MGYGRVASKLLAAVIFVLQPPPRLTNENKNENKNYLDRPLLCAQGKNKAVQTLTLTEKKHNVRVSTPIIIIVIAAEGKNTSSPLWLASSLWTTTKHTTINQVILTLIS